MTAFEARFDFAALEDTGIANIGLDAAEVAFRSDVETGLTNGDSVILVVGVLEDDQWHELGRRGFGSDFEQFAENVDAEIGKLATALRYRMDSVDAYERYRDEIPEGPQRYVGGVFHVARAKTVERGWMSRAFAGAASGVQGHFDMATVYTALTRMGAAWALKMQACYGKG